MSTRKKIGWSLTKWWTLLIALTIWQLPGAMAATYTVTAPASINAALVGLLPGDTLELDGVFNQNVVIGSEHHRITLAGKRTGSNYDAKIVGQSANAVQVFGGTQITIRDLEITTAASTNGVNVQGGWAFIQRNKIHGLPRNGININRQGFAEITDNEIFANDTGINVTDNSRARIGNSGPAGTPVALPNVIENNSGVGIAVRKSSSAEIRANTIANNGSHGIIVVGVSQAEISENDINTNTGDGIQVEENSGVNLAVTIAQVVYGPNLGAGNGGYGLRALIGAYARGTLGTLSGTLGRTNFFTPRDFDVTAINRLADVTHK